MKIDNLNFNVFNSSVPENPNMSHLLLMLSMGAISLGTFYAKKAINAGFSEEEVKELPKKTRKKVASSAEVKEKKETAKT